MSTPVIEHTTAPAPLDVLALRAWARASLWWAGLIDTIPAALDPHQRPKAKDDAAKAQDDASSAGADTERG